MQAKFQKIAKSRRAIPVADQIDQQLQRLHTMQRRLLFAEHLLESLLGDGGRMPGDVVAQVDPHKMTLVLEELAANVADRLSDVEHMSEGLMEVLDVLKPVSAPTPTSAAAS